jgi:hypothetical protein
MYLCENYDFPVGRVVVAVIVQTCLHKVLSSNFCRDTGYLD